MTKKIYEAIKVVVELAKEANPHEPPEEIAQVEQWLLERKCWDCEHGKYLNGKCQAHQK